MIYVGDSAMRTRSNTIRRLPLNKTLAVVRESRAAEDILVMRDYLLERGYSEKRIARAFLVRTRVQLLSYCLGVPVQTIERLLSHLIMTERYYLLLDDKSHRIECLRKLTKGPRHGFWYVRSSQRFGVGASYSAKASWASIAFSVGDA